MTGKIDLTDSSKSEISEIYQAKHKINTCTGLAIKCKPRWSNCCWLIFAWYSISYALCITRSRGSFVCITRSRGSNNSGSQNSLTWSDWPVKNTFELAKSHDVSVSSCFSHNHSDPRASNRLQSLTTRQSFLEIFSFLSWFKWRNQFIHGWQKLKPRSRWPHH
jgi:hypothetical protein